MKIFLIFLFFKQCLFTVKLNYHQLQIVRSLSGGNENEPIQTTDFKDFQLQAWEIIKSGFQSYKPDYINAAVNGEVVDSINNGLSKNQFLFEERGQNVAEMIIALDNEELLITFTFRSLINFQVENSVTIQQTPQFNLFLQLSIKKSIWRFCQQMVQTDFSLQEMKQDFDRLFQNLVKNNQQGIGFNSIELQEDQDDPNSPIFDETSEIKKPDRLAYFIYPNNNNFERIELFIIKIPQSILQGKTVNTDGIENPELFQKTMTQSRIHIIVKSTFFQKNIDISSPTIRSVLLNLEQILMQIQYYYYPIFDVLSRNRLIGYDQDKEQLKDRFDFIIQFLKQNQEQMTMNKVFQFEGNNGFSILDSLNPPNCDYGLVMRMQDEDLFMKFKYQVTDDSFLEKYDNIKEMAKEGITLQRLTPLVSIYDVRIFALLFFFEIYNVLNFILPFKTPLNQAHFMPSPFLDIWESPLDEMQNVSSTSLIEIMKKVFVVKFEIREVIVKGQVYTDYKKVTKINSLRKRLI